MNKCIQRTIFRDYKSVWNAYFIMDMKPVGIDGIIQIEAIKNRKKCKENNDFLLYIHMIYYNISSYFLDFNGF